MKLKVVFSIIIMLVASACNQVSFQPLSIENQKLDQQEPPYVPDPQPIRNTGACADQQSVTSCLKCEVPQNPTKPKISTKAQKLAKIMSLSCPIPNKSYPDGWVPPSKDEVYAHLVACTAELYPETPMTASQVNTMSRLLDDNNDSLRQTMFKGLWYKRPYSDDFELYFGLDNSEAAYVFCMNEPNLSPVLYTKEYWDAQGGNYWSWLANPEAQARWNFAQMLRQQLISCLNKPSTPIPDPQEPPPTAKVCNYKSFQGSYEMGGQDEITNYLSAGYKVAVETDKACVQVSKIPTAGEFSGYLKIAGYKCQ